MIYSIALSAFIVIVFVAQNLFPITDSLVLVSSDIITRPWILVTSIFIHADLRHLMSNLFALALFGFILERILGSRKFLQVFFIAGIAAGIAASLFYEASLGASGAVYGIIGSLATIRPKMIVWAFGVPMPMIVAAASWIFLDFAGLFNPTNVANAAHIAGMIAGVIMAYSYRKKEDKKEKVNNKDFEEWEERYMIKRL
jgi:uncharacterized protein